MRIFCDLVMVGHRWTTCRSAIWKKVFFIDSIFTGLSSNYWKAKTVFIWENCFTLAFIRWF